MIQTIVALMYITNAYAIPAADSLQGKPMPLIAARTLSGKVVDTGYFKGHVTIVSFMYIGCPPCMYEISTLNAIHDEYAADGSVQVLTVARQMPEQMQLFNSQRKSDFSVYRKVFHVDSIRYDIQPACPVARSKMKRSGSGESETIYLTSECSVIEDTYGVTSYPTTFYVDGKGIIRRVIKGGPSMNNSPLFYEEMKQAVEQLLAKEQH